MESLDSLEFPGRSMVELFRFWKHEAPYVMCSSQCRLKFRWISVHTSVLLKLETQLGVSDAWIVAPLWLSNEWVIYPSLPSPQDWAEPKSWKYCVRYPLACQNCWPKTSVKLTTTLNLCKSIKRLSTNPGCSILCKKGKPHLRTWTLLSMLEHRFAKEIYSVRWSSRGFCPRPVWHPSHLLSNIRKLVVLVGTALKMWWIQWWLSFETCGDVNNNMHHDILSVENSSTLEQVGKNVVFSFQKLSFWHGFCTCSYGSVIFRKFPECCSPLLNGVPDPGFRASWIMFYIFVVG